MRYFMPIISNSIQNNGERSSSVVPRSKTYRSGGTSVRLQEGQILKGVVSDVHGNEITLAMEDGSTFTGKLPDANQYSIGQKAAFQITGLADNTIYLKTITGAYLLNMEDTIEQALEEANLPKTERNLDVVRSLLNNQQSISRDNILGSIRLCAQFPQADVNAVITMKRLSLPLTADSIEQFEHYQKQTHQFLYKMNTITDEINQMLGSVGSQVPRLAGQVGQHILSLALQGGPSPEENALASTLPSFDSLPAVFDADGNIISAEQFAEENLPEMYDNKGNLLTGETQVLYADAASRKLADLNAEVEAASSGTPEAAAETVSENADRDHTTSEAAASASTDSTSDAQASGSSTASPFARMRQLFSSITDGSSILKSALVQSGESQNYRTPFIHEQIGFILPPDEREAFSQELSSLPLSAGLKASLSDGTATARELLQELQKLLPQLPDDKAGELLASKTFQKIVKAQFLSNWTISPEHMKDAGAMDELYGKISHQMDTLSHFAENTFGRAIFSQLTNTAQDMTHNLDFMRTLNQTFQYIQLPLKLQNQNAHGDLYVMTRKNSLKKDPNHLKALLHLDLDALGSLDIQITRENTAVSTHFYVDNKETKALLEKNIGLLSDAINQQGFAFTSELSMKEKDFDIVNDFAGANAPVGDFKRYNFDLRA